MPYALASPSASEPPPEEGGGASSAVPPDLARVRRSPSLPAPLISPALPPPGEREGEEGTGGYGLPRGKDLALAAAAAAAAARAREDAMSRRSSASRGMRVMADRESTQILPTTTPSPLSPAPSPPASTRRPAVHASEKPLDALRNARRSTGSLRAGKRMGLAGRGLKRPSKIKIVR